MSADVQLRDRLKAVRDELQAKRAEKVDARKERDAAKDAFASADFSDNGDQAITQTSEFLAAEDAVRKLGESQARALGRTGMRDQRRWHVPLLRGNEKRQQAVVPTQR